MRDMCIFAFFKHPTVMTEGETKDVKPTDIDDELMDLCEKEQWDIVTCWKQSGKQKKALRASLNTVLEFWEKHKTARRNFFVCVMPMELLPYDLGWLVKRDDSPTTLFSKHAAKFFEHWDLCVDFAYAKGDPEPTCMQLFQFNSAKARDTQTLEVQLRPIPDHKWKLT
jgi:hypothetical protein